MAEVGSVPRRALLNDEQQGAGWPFVASWFNPFAELNLIGLTNFQSPAEHSHDGDSDHHSTGVWDSMGGNHDHDHDHDHGHTTAPGASPSASLSASPSHAPTIPCDDVDKIENNVEYLTCINTPSSCTELYAPHTPPTHWVTINYHWVMRLWGDVWR